jgi:hypothetical protein
MIILPRQARDKHRKKKNKGVLFCRLVVSDEHAD